MTDYQSQLQQVFLAFIGAAIMLVSSNATASFCSSSLRVNTAQSIRVKAPSVGPLFRGQNPYFDPLNRSQKEFLEGLGAAFEGRYITLPPIEQMARIYNERVDQKIQDGTVRADDAVYWGEILVLNERRIVVRADRPWPDGAVLFDPQKFYTTLEENGDERFITRREAFRLRWQQLAPQWREYMDSESIPGFSLLDRAFNFVEPFALAYDAAQSTTFLFSNQEYSQSLSQGLFPVARPLGGFRAMFNYTSDYDYFNTPYEFAFFHDVGHLGGMDVEPEMMGFLRGVPRFDEARSRVRTYDVNENLVLAPESQGWVSDFVASAENLPPVEDDTDIKAYLDSLTNAQLFELIRSVISVYPELRLAIGGAARTGSFAAQLVPNRPTDFQFIQIRRFIRALIKQGRVGTEIGFDPLRFEPLLSGYGDFSQNLSPGDIANVNSLLRYALLTFLTEYDEIAGQSFLDYLGM